MVFEKGKISCEVKVIVLKNSIKTFTCEKTMVTMVVGMKNILTSLSVLRNLEKVFHIICNSQGLRNYKFAIKKKKQNHFVEPLYKGHAGGRDKNVSQRTGCFGLQVGCNLKPVLGRKGRVFVLVFLKQAFRNEACNGILMCNTIKTI